MIHKTSKKEKTPPVRELIPTCQGFGKMGWEIHFRDGKILERYGSGGLTKNERADYRLAGQEARLFLKGCRLFYKRFFTPNVMDEMAASYTGNRSRTVENFRNLCRASDMIAIAKGCEYTLTNYIDGTCQLWVDKY